MRQLSTLTIVLMLLLVAGCTNKITELEKADTTTTLLSVDAGDVENLHDNNIAQRRLHEETFIGIGHNYPGKPAHISLEMGGNDTGENLGNGNWRVELTARATDIFGYPARPGSVVRFSFADTVPPGTTVLAEGITDAEGIAYSSITYHGIYTNEEISVIARANTVSSVNSFILPLNQPRMVIAYFPGHFDIFPGDESDFYDTRIEVYLTDGQNNLVNGSTIFLTTNFGIFVFKPYGENSPLTPHIIVTQNGIAKGTLRVREWELPPPPVDEYYTTADIQLSAYLQGTNHVVQTSITIRRYSVPLPGN